MQQENQYELEDRTLAFARTVSALVNAFPRSVSNHEDATQVVRASGSVGATYSEANEAFSKKDFLLRSSMAGAEDCRLDLVVGAHSDRGKAPSLSRCHVWSQVALLLSMVSASPVGVSAGNAAAERLPAAALLANAEYRLTSVPGVVRLRDGHFQVSTAPGSAGDIAVTLTPHVATGELRGRSVAAAVLVASTGGTGSFYDLAVVVTEADEPKNLATIFLGDRIRVQSLAVRENEIVVDLIRAGPRDPLCCPTQRVVEHYRLEDARLIRVAVQDVAPPDPRLLGSAWTLKSMVRSDRDVVQVTQGGRYTLQLKPDWTVQVQADCNGAGGNYRLDGTALEIHITHTTLAACPPDSLSDHYLRMLGMVAGYGFENESLRLTLQEHGGALSFDR